MYRKGHKIVATYVLLFLSALGARKCNSGPYLFDEVCFRGNQGIGSSINKIKMQILASELFNLTLIPNPTCFQSNEHSTNFYAVFGWGRNLDCDFRAVNTSYSSSSRGKASNVKLVRVVVNDSSIDPMEAFTVCTAAFQNGALKDQVLARYIDPTKHGIWAELSRAISQSGNDQSRTVFVIDRSYTSYNIEGYQCSRDFVASRYYAAKKENVGDLGSRAVSYDREKLNIAFHFRYGDTAKVDPYYPKEPNWDVGE
jgi:hypothetical protein